MTVEFLDSDEGPDHHETGPDDASGDGRVRLLGLADAVLSLAAAALLVVAGFGTVYEVSGLTDGFDYRITAWGRIDTGTTDFAGGHGPRTGILLCVVAGLTVLALAARYRTRLGPALGVGALGAALATLGSLVLDVVAARDSIDLSADVAVDTDTGAASPRPPDFSVGSSVWVTAAAVGCALLGLVVPLVARLPASRTGTPELSDDDERLG